MLGLVTYTSILLGLLVGTWIRPAVGLAAVLSLYGLKQWGQSSTALLSEYRQFTNYAVFALCIIGVVRAAGRRGCVVCGLSTSAWLVLVLYLYALLSIIWAPDLATSLDQWVITAPYILTITLLAPLLIDDLDDARKAFLATAFAGAALCLLALLFGHWGDRGLVLFGHEALQDDYNIYKYETNPLALSTLAGTVFVIASLSLSRPNGLLMRLFALVCIPSSLVVILKSGSRGQLVASILSVLVALPISFKPRDGRSVAGLTAAAGSILGLVCLGISFVDFTSGRWSNDRASQDLAGRFEMAQRLLGASTSHFLTTVFGLGNSSSFKVVGIYPHITGLEVLAEEGLVGALLYAAVLYLAFRSVRRISRQPELSAGGRNALAILTALFVFELVLSWKQGSLLFSVYVFAYAILLSRLESPSPSPSAASSLAAARADANEGALARPFPNLLP